MFEEREADDAVVSSSVEGESCFALVGSLGVDPIYAVGVEDLVYTILPSR